MVKVLISASCSNLDGNNILKSTVLACQDSYKFGLMPFIHLRYSASSLSVLTFIISVCLWVNISVWFNFSFEIGFFFCLSLYQVFLFVVFSLWSVRFLFITCLSMCVCVCISRVWLFVFLLCVCLYVSYFFSPSVSLSLSVSLYVCFSYLFFCLAFWPFVTSYFLYVTKHSPSLQRENIHVVVDGNTPWVHSINLNSIVKICLPAVFNVFLHLFNCN